MNNKDHELRVSVYERILSDCMLKNFDILDNPDEFPTLAAHMHLTIEPFVEKGVMKEIEEITPDYEKKMLYVKVSFMSDVDPMEVILSWGNLNKFQVEQYLKRQKEELERYGSAIPNSKVISADYRRKDR